MLGHSPQTEGVESEVTPQLSSLCSACLRAQSALRAQVQQGGLNGQKIEDLMAQMADIWASSDPQAIAKVVLRYLSQVTHCFAAGLLLVDGVQGQIMLVRSRPVDDLFLQAVQQRLMRSYQLCVGPGQVEPDVEVTIYGDSISGPYEPPRSVLTTPILSEGRAVGMLVVASIFPDAFHSEDLCALSVLAAQISTSLHRMYQATGRQNTSVQSLPEASSAAWSAEGVLMDEDLQCKVRDHLKAICKLARRWQEQDLSELPGLLGQDLDVIVQNVLRIRDLLVS